MNNRAKCKLCSSIIESFHAQDFVPCKCGEIFVDGGPGMRCGAKSWDNFLRVDDDGNIIVPTIHPGKSMEKKVTPSMMKSNIEALIKQISDLPSHALDQPLNHYDYISLLGLVSGVLSLVEDIDCDCADKA